MAQEVSRTDRIIRILASLLVLVFAAILIFRFSPWGVPESNASEGSTQSIASNPSEDVIPVELQLSNGTVKIELWRDIAPRHVEQVTRLMSEGFYDGIVFHRVIDGFMAQTGDPTGTGMGGSELDDLEAEFSEANFSRGVLGMARSSSPNSANSQFFIVFEDAPHLNRQYTAFGRVVSGMEHVDAIKKGDPSANGMVVDPDKIVSLKLSDE